MMQCEKEACPMCNNTIKYDLRIFSRPHKLKKLGSKSKVSKIQDEYQEAIEIDLTLPKSKRIRYYVVPVTRHIKDILLSPKSMKLKKIIQKKDIGHQTTEIKLDENDNNLPEIRNYDSIQASMNVTQNSYSHSVSSDDGSKLNCNKLKTPENSSGSVKCESSQKKSPYSDEDEDEDFFRIKKRTKMQYSSSLEDLVGSARKKKANFREIVKKLCRKQLESQIEE